MKTDELKALAHELAFWKGFVQTERFLVGWCSDVKTPELRDEVHRFIVDSFKHHPKVLDIGSGVVSILNGTVAQRHLTAADILGDMYKIIFDYDYHGINPPIAIPGEELKFENQFDVVHISNAIDHTQNPKLVFANLVKACKKGGYVIIQGFENEGKFENYQGMHQWDFVLADNNHIRITNNYLMHWLTAQGDDVNCEEYPEIQVVKTYLHQFEKKNWYIWIGQKK